MAHDGAGRTTDCKDGKYAELADLANSSNVMEPSTSFQPCIEFEKSQAKCSQTKSYCQDFIQSFEELMQKCSHDTIFRQRLYCKVVYALVTHVHGLCKCEQCLLKLKSVIDQLCSSCARYIISEDFSSLPEAFRLNLSDALQAAQEVYGDWAGDRFFRLAGLCVAPWSHPFLVGIMEGSSGPQGFERTQNYISYEGFDLLSSRVQILLANDPGKAIKLCQACSQHSDIGEDTVFLETVIVVLYNQGMPPDFSMQVWIQDSKRVLRALERMLTYYPAPVVKLVDTLLLKEWNEEYASLKAEQFQDLLKLWVEAHYQHGSLDEVYRAAVDLAMYNDNTQSVILFSDTIIKQVGPQALPLFVNLLVDNIQVPFHQLDENECDMANQNNALISERLADTLWESSELHCLCRMAHFVSCPSKSNHLKLMKAYDESSKDNRHPDVPLLSSRLDLILTKVILGLLPKAFNPWKDWDNLKHWCQKLQKTTQQIEVKNIDGAGNLSKVVTYRKASWFLTMLEDDWPCYAKGNRDQDGEVVCDSQDQTGDAVKLLTEISEDKPASADTLDRETNQVQTVTHENECYPYCIKSTKTDKTQNKCSNSENKIKGKNQVARKSMKSAKADSNKIKKSRGLKNIDDEQELNEGQKCMDANHLGDEVVGTNPASPLTKCTVKKHTEPPGNTENTNGLNGIFGIKQRNGIKRGRRSKKGNLVTIQSGESTRNDPPNSLNTLEKSSSIENATVDSSKQTQKVGKKRRRQRDDFGIGRRRKKPQKKNQSSEEKSSHFGLKSQEADDELDDSETDEEPMSDVISGRNSTSEMVSSKSNETPLNRCCLTQLETPPPDTNSYLQLPVKPDSQNTQMPPLTPQMSCILPEDMFTNGDCVKDQVCLIELDHPPRKKKKLGKVSSSKATPLKKKNRKTNESERGHKVKFGVPAGKYASRVKVANNASPVKEANNVLRVKEMKTVSPIKDVHDPSPVKEANNPSSVKEAKNVALVKETKNAFFVKEANNPSSVELNNPSPVKEGNSASPVKEAKDASPVKEVRNASPVTAAKDHPSPVKEAKHTSPVNEQKALKSTMNHEEKFVNNKGVNNLTGTKMVDVSTTKSSGALQPVNHHILKIGNDARTHHNNTDHTNGESEILMVNVGKTEEPSQSSLNELPSQTKLQGLPSETFSTHKLGDAQTSKPTLAKAINSEAGGTKVASKGTHPNQQTFPCTLKGSPGMRLTHSRVVELSLKKSAKKKQCVSKRTNVELDEKMSVDLARGSVQDSVQEWKLMAQKGTDINDGDSLLDEICKPDKNLDVSLSQTNHQTTLNHNLPMRNELLTGYENRIHTDISQVQTTEMNGVAKKRRRVRRKGKRVVLKGELRKEKEHHWEKEISKSDIGAEFLEGIEHGLFENSEPAYETKSTEKHNEDIQENCCEKKHQLEKDEYKCSGEDELTRIIQSSGTDKTASPPNDGVFNSKERPVRKQPIQHQSPSNYDMKKSTECENDKHENISRKVDKESESKKKRTNTAPSKIRTVYGTRSSNQKLNSTEENDKNLVPVVNKRIGRSPTKSIIISKCLVETNSAVEMHNTRFRHKKCIEIHSISQVMDKIMNGQANSVDKTKTCESVQTNVSSVNATNQCILSEGDNTAKQVDDAYRNTQTSNRGTDNVERVRRSSGRHASEKSNSRATKIQSKSPNKNNTISDSVEAHLPAKLDSPAKSAEEAAALNRKPQPRRICTRQCSAESRLANCVKVSPSLNLVNESSTESKPDEATIRETRRGEESEEDKPLFKEIKRYTRERKTL